ncbi:hypothetical protein Rsub_03908 [Raphidocelis subcapitata]|uniref:Uncharacterized protein n=1 Tax=Raphidocelis subcapitata TaxID=307507 RepID=A0A2V0NWJ6_9CHLO|nr:hypothetical protein Rsub_03908 [Raphidocelis subcapitata]|eukprot:GBF91052.1 hypothetical protein Rsub_03908 [Raphidocelis subcapitata]
MHPAFDSLLDRWRRRERGEGTGSPRGARHSGGAKGWGAGGAGALAAPDAPQEALIPWSQVEQMLQMSRNALAAKQKASEHLQQETERLHDQRSIESEHWSKLVARAEIDSGALLEQLESVMTSKRAVVLERAELARAVELLRAERALVCHQLRVDPANANLCRAVEVALADARRSGPLEARLRVLSRQRRALRADLEAARHAHARGDAAWRAREAAMRRALAAAGAAAPPDLPAAPAPAPAVSSLAAGEQAAGGADAAAGAAAAAGERRMRRALSLDSGLDEAQRGALERAAAAVCGDEEDAWGPWPPLPGEADPWGRCLSISSGGGGGPGTARCASAGGGSGGGSDRGSRGGGGRASARSPVPGF